MQGLTGFQQEKLIACPTIIPILNNLTEPKLIPKSALKIFVPNYLL